MTTNVYIKNRGVPGKPKFVFNLGENQYVMATSDMYLAFKNTFNNESNARNFFSSNEPEGGITLLRVMLTNVSCPIFDPNLSGDSEYTDLITDVFNIIIRFTSSLPGQNAYKSIYSSYVEMIPGIRKKIEKILTKESQSFIVSKLESVIGSLSTVTTNTVIDFSQIIRKEGSIESAKNQILNSSVINKISNLFLSPIDPGVFNLVRQFCINFVGEGRRVSDADSNDGRHIISTMKRIVGLVRHKMTTKKSGKDVSIDLYCNPNNISDINTILICLFNSPDSPSTALTIIKILKILNSVMHSEENKDLTKTLEDIFKPGVTFEPIIPSDSYIFGNFSTTKYVRNSLGENVTIPIRIAKHLVSFLRDGTRDHSSDRKVKEESESILNSVITGSFGDTKAGLTLDWWQNLFIDKTKDCESFILIGDTSGGKTFISLEAMRVLFNQNVNDPSSPRFIYVAPTPQLAILQFANILTAYPNYSDKFGICCKSIVNIPESARILIGTPVELKRYLFDVKYQRGTVLDLDNIETQMEDAIRNQFSSSVRTVFIDEIQTWSRTYIQDVEIEHLLECKAIDEILSCVNFENDPKSQVIGMSATLSETSIQNIKERISRITKIPYLTDIIYGHDDIGRVDKNDPFFKPSMVKPIVKAVNINGVSQTSFGKDDPIVEQHSNISNIENIVRDAESNGVLPIAFFFDSELTSIYYFKEYLDHLERKSVDCNIWQTLYTNYNEELKDGGYTKMSSPGSRAKWETILSENIRSVITDINNKSVVDLHRFSQFSQLIIDFSRGSTVQYSDELYGLLFEYYNFKNGKPVFSRRVHPYYRFGNTVSSNGVFLLKDSSNNDTPLKKILLAQEADPSSNTGSIISLIMRGIEYGCSILTSSVPLGVQLELYKFYNIKGKTESVPIPVLFCEYGMSMGMNTSIMSVCIYRSKLTQIGASEFKQIAGRPGRRGNTSGLAPIVYTFNIENTYQIEGFETLTFDLSDVSSTFFQPNEVFSHLTKILTKFENQKEVIFGTNTITSVEPLISGDLFKFIDNESIFIVRRIQLAKLQIREIFNDVRNINPSIANNQLRSFYAFLQRAEMFYLNIQIS